MTPWGAQLQLVKPSNRPTVQSYFSIDEQPPSDLIGHAVSAPLASGVALLAVKAMYISHACSRTEPNFTSSISGPLLPSDRM